MVDMLRAWLIVLAGCGRLGFEPAPTGDAQTDGDTQAACGFDLCDGFEAPTLDTSLWTVAPMITRDTSVAHRGNASVRMHTNALSANQAGAAALTETRTFASSPTTIWVRAWLRLSALPAGANAMDVIALDQTSAPFGGNFVFVRSDQVGVYSFDGLYAGTLLDVPLDTWFCILWHVRLSTPNGGILEVSGDLFDQLQILNGQTDGQPRIDTLRIGINFAPPNVPDAQPPLDLWLDDVIIHSAPVSCAD